MEGNLIPGMPFLVTIRKLRGGEDGLRLAFPGFDFVCNEPTLVLGEFSGIFTHCCLRKCNGKFILQSMSLTLTLSTQYRPFFFFETADFQFKLLFPTTNPRVDTTLMSYMVVVYDWILKKTIKVSSTLQNF